MRGRQIVNLIQERFRRTHELSPAVSRDVHTVMDLDAGTKTIIDKSNVDVRLVAQCFAEHATIRHFCRISLRQLLDDVPSECRAVPVNARTAEKYDRIARLNVTTNEA